MTIDGIIFELKIPKVEGRPLAPVSPTVLGLSDFSTTFSVLPDIDENNLNTFQKIIVR